MPTSKVHIIYDKSVFFSNFVPIIVVVEKTIAIKNLNKYKKYYVEKILRLAAQAHGMDGRQ